MKGYEGQIAASISLAIMTFFTNFNISRLWMNQSAWNWWPNWRVFAALEDGKNFFDRYDPQFFLMTMEANAKNWTFFGNWAILDNKSGYFQFDNWPKIHKQNKVLFES